MISDVVHVSRLIMSLLFRCGFGMCVIIPTVKSIEDYRRAEKGPEGGNSLQRLNGIAQDELALLRSMQFRHNICSTLFCYLSRTRTGITSTAESITDSLLHAHQLTASEESTMVLKKAESEYRAHCSLLMRSCDLLSTMSGQDVLDKLIVSTGFLFFFCVVVYVVLKRIGLLKL